MRLERIEWDGLEADALAVRIRELVPPTEGVTSEVAEIVARVRRQGDTALRELAIAFGETPPERLRVEPQRIRSAAGLLDEGLRDSMRAAAANIYAVARAELERLERPATVELPQGQRVEVISAPVASAGVYAPGGRGAYPSSVLMCCLPALAAGVSRVVVVTPPGGEGRPSDAVLAACALCRVEEVYAVGGAQAIAALAYGTDTIDAVDVVVGPGNRYVTEAKRAVAGQVGIDGIAGPSELLIVADGTAPPQAIALDLCAQAEHGNDSLLALVSHNAVLVDDVAERVTQIAAERASVSDAPLALVTAPGLQRSLELADALAPEHLELAFEGADEASARGRIAGSAFVGSGGATAFGDYAAGSNHVLPTGGAARFGGPLGPGAFMRRTSVVGIGSGAARELAPHVEALARAEGFGVHGESAAARTRQ
jgi:histidinol dehydrogenase